VCVWECGGGSVDGLRGHGVRLSFFCFFVVLGGVGRVYVCNQCDHSTSSTSHLLIHMYTQNNETQPTDYRPENARTTRKKR
jgi:hypothetical protein